MVLLPLVVWTAALDWQMLSLEACVYTQALQSFYLKVSRESPSASPVTGLPVNLHLLESLVRLAEARARADLRQVLFAVP